MLNKEALDQIIVNYLNSYKERLAAGDQIQKKVQADAENRLQLMKADLQTIEAQLKNNEFALNKVLESMPEEGQLMERDMKTGVWTTSLVWGSVDSDVQPLMHTFYLKKTQAVLEREKDRVEFEKAYLEHILLSSVEPIKKVAKEAQKKAEEIAHLEKTLLAMSYEEVARVFPAFLNQQAEGYKKVGNYLEASKILGLLEFLWSSLEMPAEQISLDEKALLDELDMPVELDEQVPLDIQYFSLELDEQVPLNIAAQTALVGLSADELSPCVRV